ncbi:hypothetical protein [Palleronia abyssalis]|uniref:hypothetical protein n=1 Tax=Palleronia abyssalis TaxID=1501240 RepID=UPI0011B22FB9|nr:hypothetical protein [Palleronia abyssalis]
MSRPILIAALCALPTGVLAQHLTWGELVTPDRIVRSGVQAALWRCAARSTCAGPTWRSTPGAVL